MSSASLHSFHKGVGRMARTFDVLAPAILGAVFLVARILETRRPLRPRSSKVTSRITKNVALAATSAVPMRLLVLPAMLAAAEIARVRGWGFARMLSRRPMVQAAGAMFLLDGSMYLWHRANHALPLLWRFHRVHHLDRDVDASTALRFHPGEMTLSTFARVGQILAIGPSPGTVVAFEILMQACAELHHTNVALPPAIERLLNLLVVTPRMHGIHHSEEESDRRTNLGVISSLWDRLFSTFGGLDRGHPITIGVDDDGEPSTVAGMLAAPFEK